MKKSHVIIVAIVVIVAVLALVGTSLTAWAEPQSGESVREEKSIKIAHISDIHIMIPEYCNIYSAAYSAAGNTSYKVLEQTEATAEAVCNEMIANAGGVPQYVVITGDLTSNGELANHLGVAALLRRVTERMREKAGDGFQIFVIPGNHDIDNQNAKCYTPALDDAEWNRLVSEKDADGMRRYLAGLGSRSVQTTTMLQFMSIYSDFGYCNCEHRKEGVHDAGCRIAQGVALEYFYESDYWYVPNVTRSYHPEDLGDKAVPLTPTYTYQYEYSVSPAGALTETTPTKAEEAGFKVDKDMEYYARASRHGACSYVARINGTAGQPNVTVLGIDANSHKWTTTDKGTAAVVSSLGWEETTGGYMTKAQLNWLADEVKDDVRNRNLILALAHENILPHFDTEDEVISLFCYDNWEDVYTNMADNGIRYSFTGHQHTNDIESDVAQSGSVFFDFETGSTTCMGAGWRELDFTQTYYEGGAFAEDVWSTMHYLHYNEQVAGKDAFGYDRYEVLDNGTFDIKHVYQCKEDGSYYDLADYMSLSLKKMITNIAGNFVNENLMEKLHGMLKGLETSEDWGFLYGLADKAVTDLGNLNLYRFTANADGSFSLSAEPDPDYHLTRFAVDLTAYFLNKDYSFGRSATPLHLDDVLLYVYGNHLIGGQLDNEADIPADIKVLLDVLEDGTFLRFVEQLLYEGVVPQLELILNAPIYWGDSLKYRPTDISSVITPDMVANGKGFDLHEYGDAISGGHNLIFTMVYGLIKPDTEIGVEGMDVSNLMRFLKNLVDVLEPALDGFKEIGIDVFAIVEQKMGMSIGSYVDKAMSYIGKLEGKSLSEVLKEELLDKYVTDAFCKNLGSYGAYVVRSVLVDDSLDGVKRTADTGLFPYEVEKRFHVEVTYSGDKSALKGHTYYCDAAGNDKVKIVATHANGLLPDKVSVGNVVDADGNLDATKKEIRWFTQRDVDYANVCKPFDVDTTVNPASASDVAAKKANAKQFYSQLEYADNPAFTGSTVIRRQGENVWIEYPTIDLGITYINITYAYRQYNDFDVVLEGLQPAKTYYYRMRAVDWDGTKVTKEYEWTDTFHFRTAATSGGFSFVAISDIQGSIENNYTASLPNLSKILDHDYDYVISCGDNVDKSENISQWDWLLNDQASVWSNSTLTSVVGNHEDHHYSISYVTATPDVAEVDESGFYYSYNQQNVHFVLLNTNDIQTYTKEVPVPAEEGEDEDDEPETKTVSYLSLGQAQLDWLEADLKAANANSAIQFIVVVLHKGPYTAGSHAFDADVVALRAQLTPLFAKYKVDVVLQGHDHCYSVSEYIGGTYSEEQGKYLPTAVSYDATGAAIDPEGVLYVNLGTMGDKYYNYIYSPEVTLRDRTQDNYLRLTLSDYLTADGRLELSPVRNSRTVLPETPVYMYVDVQDGRLSLTTYTIIDGQRYVVDDIAITKAPKSAAVGLKVMGANLSAKDLDALECVRVTVSEATGETVYVGYRLADVLAKAGKKATTFRYDGQKYAVSDAYVLVGRTSATSSEVESIDALVMVCADGTAVFANASDVTGALPVWAIAVIVVAAAIVAALLCLLIMLILKRKSSGGAADAAGADASISADATVDAADTKAEATDDADAADADHPDDAE